MFTSLSYALADKRPRKETRRLRRRRNSRRRRVMRIRLAEAQNWRCCYCGERLEIEQTTTEHVIPLSEWGDDCWDNMVMACSPCNFNRSNRPIMVFLAMR